MNVHNLMEEIVYNEVNALFDTAKESNAQWLTCSCNQCRFDTICYVLNRIPPRYIKSGRGLVHSQYDESIDKPQVSADINRIALEGMKQVMGTKRPHCGTENTLPDTPVFNFPTIVGRILDGKTFEPMKNISVRLLMDGQTASSIDSSWENPFRVNAHTPGNYTFWVRPISSNQAHEKKVFAFEIQITEPSFEEVHYFFELGITSESVLRTAYSAEHAYILPDLHLFKSNEELDRMQY